MDDAADHPLDAELRRATDAARRFEAAFRGGPGTARPARRLAILACMDARLHLEDLLGLQPGDAHMIRNAGGLATDDAIRSLILSQRVLGTEAVIVIGHTGCGLIRLDEARLRQRVAEETGIDADVGFGAFDDLDASVRASVERIRTHPWTKDGPVHGFVFEVETGRLRQVI